MFEFARRITHRSMSIDRCQHLIALLTNFLQKSKSRHVQKVLSAELRTLEESVARTGSGKQVLVPRIGLLRIGSLTRIWRDRSLSYDLFLVCCSVVGFFYGALYALDITSSKVIPFASYSLPIAAIFVVLMNILLHGRTTSLVAKIKSAD